MASNLTRDEARERARLLSVQSYQVELDLPPARHVRLGDNGALHLLEPGVGTRSST